MGRLKRIKSKAEDGVAPTHLEIVSRRIAVIADDDCEDMGQWDSNAQTITYAPEQSVEMLRDTIWHEIWHAVIEDINGDKVQEAVIRRGSTITLHALRHNTSLRKLLFGDLEEWASRG